MLCNRYAIIREQAEKWLKLLAQEFKHLYWSFDTLKTLYNLLQVFSLFLWHLKILGKVFGREEAIGNRKIYMARAFGGYRRHNHFLYFSSV